MNLLSICVSVFLLTLLLSGADAVRTRIIKLPEKKSKEQSFEKLITKAVGKSVSKAKKKMKLSKGVTVKCTDDECVFNFSRKVVEVSANETTSNTTRTNKTVSKKHRASEHHDNL